MKDIYAERGGRRASVTWYGQSGFGVAAGDSRVLIGTKPSRLINLLRYRVVDRQEVDFSERARMISSRSWRRTRRWSTVMNAHPPERRNTTIARGSECRIRKAAGTVMDELPIDLKWLHRTIGAKRSPDTPGTGRSRATPWLRAPRADSVRSWS